jgi:hypothetical protein
VRPTQSSASLEPRLTWVSNCWSQNGWLSEAQDRFEVGREIVPANHVRVVVAGQFVEDDALTRLTQDLSERNEPAIAADLMENVVRDVAARNSNVGKNLLVSSLPRAAGHRGS